MVKMAGGDLTRVDLSDSDFRLEPALDDLAAAVSDETKLLIVNSPSNPTGAVYSDAALEGVRDLAVEHDITVISDEIYKEITYGVEPTSLGTLEGMADRTVTVNGFSKAYSMTGWRLGYFAGPEELIDQAGKLHSHSVSSAVNFVQHAGLEALETEDAVTEMTDAFEERRDLVVDLLAEHDVDVAVPEGAFYMMLPADDDDQAWCEGAIEDAHVAVPGSAFGGRPATRESRMRRARNGSRRGSSGWPRKATFSWTRHGQALHRWYASSGQVRRCFTACSDYFPRLDGIYSPTEPIGLMDCPTCGKSLNTPNGECVSTIPKSTITRFRTERVPGVNPFYDPKSRREFCDDCNPNGANIMATGRVERKPPHVIAVVRHSTIIHRTSLGYTVRIASRTPMNFSVHRITNTTT